MINEYNISLRDVQYYKRRCEKKEKKRIALYSSFAIVFSKWRDIEINFNIVEG